MGLISQKDVSSLSVSEMTGQLARIQSQADGDAAVALLDDYDRLLLNSAINSYSKEKDISISDIAKELGIGRTYLYNLLDSNQIEINRLRIIQNYLDINILSEDVIDLYIRDLKEKLYGKSYDSNWKEKCCCIKVDQYYLLEFLLPAMKTQVNNWEYYISLSDESDKSIFGNVASDDNYKFTKMIKYVEDLDLDWAEVQEKFHANLKSDFIYIPIDPLSSYWADVEDLADENIYEYCDALASDIKNQLEKASSKTEKEDLDQCIAFFEKDLRKTLDKCHKEFNKQLDKEYEKIKTAQEKILKYMSTNERLERKQSHWPLELLDFAENLENNTIPKKEKKLNNNAKK